MPSENSCVTNSATKMTESNVTSLAGVTLVEKFINADCVRWERSIGVPANSINIYKRDVQGVIVMRIEEGNKLVSVERVENEEEPVE